MHGERPAAAARRGAHGPVARGGHGAHRRALGGAEGDVHDAAREHRRRRARAQPRPGSAAASRAGSRAGWRPAGRAGARRSRRSAPRGGQQPARRPARAAGRGSTPARPSRLTPRAGTLRVGSAWARAASIIRPKGTPLGHAASQARHARHSSIIVVKERVNLAVALLDRAHRGDAPARRGGLAAGEPEGRAVGQAEPAGDALDDVVRRRREAARVPARDRGHAGLPEQHPPVEDPGRVEGVAQPAHQLQARAAAGPRGRRAGRRGRRTTWAWPPSPSAQAARALDRPRGSRRRPGRSRRPCGPRSRGPAPSRRAARSPRRGGGTPASSDARAPRARGAARRAAPCPRAARTSSSGPVSSTATAPGVEQHRGRPRRAGQRAGRGGEPLAEGRLDAEPAARGGDRPQLERDLDDHAERARASRRPAAGCRSPRRP